MTALSRPGFGSPAPPRRVGVRRAAQPTRLRPDDLPDEGYDQLVLARGIPVHSWCEHHLLPFHGVAHVAQPHPGPGGWPTIGAGGLNTGETVVAVAVFVVIASSSVALPVLAYLAAHNRVRTTAR